MKKINFCLLSIILFIFIGCSSTKASAADVPETVTEVQETAVDIQETTADTDEANEEIIMTQEVFTGMMPNINGTVFGDILGDGTLQGIPNIEITLDDQQFVVTYTDGTYLIPNVTDGKHTLYIHDPDGKENGLFKDESVEVIYDSKNERYLNFDIYLYR